MIDFHTHILPGIDDGSDCVQTSLKMLHMEAEQGITHVVATPHFYACEERLDRFLSNRSRAEEILRNEMRRYPQMPQLLIGAEVLFFRGISESNFIQHLTIEKTSCILVEMGQPPWSESIYKELDLIYQRWGITPIIAHIDRYITPLRTYGIPQRLADLPVLIQANSSFFLNHFTAGMAIKMLRNDQIHLLGSDCHNLTTRDPNLGNAQKVIESRLGGDAVKKILAQSLRVLNSKQSTIL